jgi:hypothetical protein
VVARVELDRAACFEQPAQLHAAALDPRLQRRQRHPQARRGGGLRAALELDQGDRLAIRRGQPRDERPDAGNERLERRAVAAVRGSGIGAQRRDRLGHHALEARIERDGRMLAPAVIGDRAPRDLVDPRGDPLLVAHRRRAAMDPHERVLHDVLGVAAWHARPDEPVQLATKLAPRQRDHAQHPGAQHAPPAGSSRAGSPSGGRTAVIRADAT